MTLLKKLQWFSLFIVFLFTASSMFAYFSTSYIGERFEIVARQHIPLRDAIDDLSSSVVKQSGRLERGITFAYLEDADAMASTIEQFDLLAESAEGELALTASLIAKIQSDAEHDLNTQIELIADEFDVFYEDAYELLTVLEAGELEYSRQGINDIHWQADQLIELLELLSGEIGAQTQAEVTQSEHYAGRITMMVGVFGPAAIAGVLLALFLVYLSVTRQLGADPSALVEVAENLAGGRLDATAGSDRGVSGSLRQTVAKLEEVIGHIQMTAEEVSIAAAQLEGATDSLSCRISEQASGLREVSASMDTLTEGISSNAEHLQVADKLASSAEVAARNGSEVIRSAGAAMDNVLGSTAEISNISALIDEIAFQTNLLSLNAAVEAARAGEEGRGFAVVANEVRRLAARSAEAAKEIKKLVDDSTGKVDQGARLVEDSGEKFLGILSESCEVNKVVERVAEAGREQAHSIAEVNRAVASMDQSTEQNASLVDEAAAAASSLGKQAEELKQLLAYFRPASETAS